MPARFPGRGRHEVGDIWLVITSLSMGLCYVEPGAAPLWGVWRGAAGPRTAGGVAGATHNTPLPQAGDRTQGWLLGYIPKPKETLPGGMGGGGAVLWAVLPGGVILSCHRPHGTSAPGTGGSALTQDQNTPELYKGCLLPGSQVLLEKRGKGDT